MIRNEFFCSLKKNIVRGQREHVDLSSVQNWSHYV